MNIKLQDLTFDVIQQLFADVLAQKYGQLNFPNASDSTTTVRNERDLEYWKTGIMNGYGNIELELNPEASNSREQIKVLDPKFLTNKNRYIDAKASYLDSERSAGRTSGLDEETINEEMTPGDYIKFLMDKFYEYRMLAADPTINDQATKLYLEKASDYYARAQEAMDEIEPDNTDHLSDEDKALPNVSLADQENELNNENTNEMFTKQARQYDQWADDNDKLKAKKAAELSDKDKAMIDKYEDEEANREVPRDYASMYEAEGDEELSPTDQMIQKLIDMASKGEFDNDQIRNLGQQLTSARKRYFTAQRSPESYKVAAEKAKQTKIQQKADAEAGEKEREKQFNSPLDVPIDPSNREKFKDEAEKIRRIRGQLPWNVSSSDRTPNPKYYDLVGTDDETGVKQYKLKGEWKGKVVTDYNDLNPNTGKYEPLSTKDDDIFINETRWAKLSGLDK
jgi:hypothetical protein